MNLLLVILVCLYTVPSTITFIDGVVECVYGRKLQHRLIYFIMPYYYIGYYIVGPLFKVRGK